MLQSDCKLHPRSYESWSKALRHLQRLTSHAHQSRGRESGCVLHGSAAGICLQDVQDGGAMAIIANAGNDPRKCEKTTLGQSHGCRDLWQNLTTTRAPVQPDTPKNHDLTQILFKRWPYEYRKRSGWLAKESHERSWNQRCRKMVGNRIAGVANACGTICYVT